MSEIISKELLSEVLGDKVHDFLDDSTQDINLGKNEMRIYFGGHSQVWNKSELADKMIKWAFYNGYTLKPYIQSKNVFACDFKKAEFASYTNWTTATHDSRIEVVSFICEWILDNEKNNQN